MSSKKAMKLAQKYAFAKHRSNITNTKFRSKKKLLLRSLINLFFQIEKFSFFFHKPPLCCKWIF